MIALRAIEPEPNERYAERCRIASKRRLRHAHRRGYAAFVRVGVVAVMLVAPLMLYVMLTANVTSLNYAVAHAQTQKVALLAETMRQEDRIAKLESRERLAALAARMGMHDPSVYAVVDLPRPKHPVARVHGIALLGAVGQWLDTAVSGAPR